MTAAVVSPTTVSPTTVSPTTVSPTTTTAGGPAAERAPAATGAATAPPADPGTSTRPAPSQPPAQAPGHAPAQTPGRANAPVQPGRHRPAIDVQRESAIAQKPRSKRGRLLFLIPILLIVVAAATIMGYRFWYESTYFISPTTPRSPATWSRSAR